jgi:NTE family protein
MCDVIADEASAAARQLSSVPLLSALDESALSAFEAELDSLSLAGGGILFREGEVGTALYIVTAGSLGVTVRGEDGHDALVARVQSGETVGEMALLDGGLRSATVFALRDTELLRLERRSYERLIEQHPRSILPLMSLLVRRLRIATHHRTGLAMIRTVALVPLDAEAEQHSLARDLADRLAANGQRVRLLDRKSAAYTTHWFNAAEVACDLVLYCSDLIDSRWTKLCLRQADRVLLIASSHCVPQETWLAIRRIGDGQWTSSCCMPTAGAQCGAPLSTGTNDCKLVLFAMFAAEKTTISTVSPGCCEASQSALSSALAERVALRISESFVRCAKQEFRLT